MTADQLLARLRDLDAELHSGRVTNYYRSQDEATRARFVGLRGWVSAAVSDATYARLDDLADELQRHEAALDRGFSDVRAELARMSDANRALDIVADVLTVLSVAIPGIIDHAT